MHPDYKSDHPGDCPVCGMKLVAVSNSAVPSGPGQDTDSISPDQQRLLGLVVAEVQRAAIVKTISAAGHVALGNPIQLPSPVAGTIQECRYSITGGEAINVNRGDLLLTIASPEFATLQQQFLETSTGNTGPSSAAAQSSAKLDALGFGARQRAALLATRRVSPLYEIRSPVAARLVSLLRPGASVTATSNVCTLTDLSSLSVQADIAGLDIPLIRVGQEAEGTLLSDPSHVWHGFVTALYQQYDDRMQSMKIKVDFTNTSKLVWQGMLVDLKIRSRLAPCLVVPESALLRSSEQARVYLVARNNAFTARNVRVGQCGGGQCQILDGLKTGDRVVASANFLLDAETQLRHSQASHTP